MKKSILIVLLALFQFIDIPLPLVGDLSQVTICEAKKKKGKKSGKGRGRGGGRRRITIKHTGVVKRRGERTKQREKALHASLSRAKSLEQAQMRRSAEAIRNMATQAKSQPRDEASTLRLIQERNLTSAQINAKDRNGFTYLHHATMNGWINLARYLLQKGASPTIRDASGSTAIDWAEIMGNTSMIKLLKSKG